MGPMIMGFFQGSMDRALSAFENSDRERLREIEDALWDQNQRYGAAYKQSGAASDLALAREAARCASHVARLIARTYPPEE